MALEASHLPVKGNLTLSAFDTLIVRVRMLIQILPDHIHQVFPLEGVEPLFFIEVFENAE
jgi:hypothetical protein